MMMMMMMKKIIIILIKNHLMIKQNMILYHQILRYGDPGARIERSGVLFQAGRVF